MGKVTTTTAPTVIVRDPAQIRRGRNIGIVYLILAAVTVFSFALGTEGDAVFRLGARPGEIDVTVPAAGLAWFTAGLCAVLGVVHLITAGLGRWTNLVLGAIMVLFAVTFLGWAAAGNSFSMAGMLASTVAAATPIAFGGLSGVMSERVGVINIGIEGMLLIGAFMGAFIGSVAGPLLGVVGAMAAGGLMALLLAVLAIRYRVDQIIAGVVINILALGLTSFLSSQILVENSAEFNSPDILSRFPIPGLSSIPVIGPILFNQNIFVYGLMILIVVLTYALFKTRWGLRSRSVGEHPKAADTLGIDVYWTRYRNVVMGGLIAGFGGAFFTLGTVGSFNENMTAGRGFIGLAAMIFGRWHPVGVFGAALVFGFADALQVRLAILNVNIASEFLAMIPYLVTIFVVAGLVGRSRPPAANGQPYIKG
ncbi:MAG: ABC transporter permease [Acidimicrobiia bacterium]|nr:ABC transporter permease [Acidimicrobiia bacterium]